MIAHYPAEERYQKNLDWLKSRLSFSFGDFYDEDNTNFGCLRVFNNDIISGHRGFGAHPHREMEIVSIVLSGQLKHEDSTGHTAVTGFGGVQRMSAGTGIIHSEVNPADEPCELMQIWFTPSQPGLPPSYETSTYEIGELQDRLLPIVSGQGHAGKGVAHIHQDLTIYMSDLSAGQSLVHATGAGRRLYLFVIEGALAAGSSQQLQPRDAARITGETELLLQTEEGARLLLIDMP
ncbi:pirin family protein [Paenibacillus sp. 1P07SE]|uniref:pirin family protein n=1 Tax=Paenibacillus sp. 1P07SE TaxID=3132209 RepID=UPI0039A5EA72